jgi:outer membrane biosynthesis protein TonB
MASSIGIKIANGEFYPLLEENSLIRKRLILTTVHDNQPSMQIDLYRSTTHAMADAQYIGSVVVENIKPRLKGEPSIEMVISSNAGGDIIAEAIDLDTGSGGEHYVLTVSLKSIDETSRDLEIPDFELETNEDPPSGLYRRAEKIKKAEKRRSFLWFFIILIIILGLLAAWLFYLGGMDTVKPIIDKYISQKTAPPALAVQPEPVREPEPVRQPASEPAVQSEPVQNERVQPEPVQTEIVSQTVEPVPVIQAPASPPAPATRPRTVSDRPPPPVASYNVPATIPREGVNYIVRWGDTLWDISDAFYRDPWLYPRIARHNNIRNPNHIISGRTIRIPPKN